MISGNLVSGLANLAESAYLDFSNLLVGGLGRSALATRLTQQGEAEWLTARPEEFALQWRVEAHRPNTASGFSGAIFNRVDPRPRERLHGVAIRGNEGNIFTLPYPDLLAADAR